MRFSHLTLRPHYKNSLYQLSTLNTSVQIHIKTALLWLVLCRNEAIKIMKSQFVLTEPFLHKTIHLVYIIELFFYTMCNCECAKSIFIWTYFIGALNKYNKICFNAITHALRSFLNNFSLKDLLSIPFKNRITENNC